MFIPTHRTTKLTSHDVFQSACDKTDPSFSWKGTLGDRNTYEVEISDLVCVRNIIAFVKSKDPNSSRLSLRVLDYEMKN